MTSTELGYLSGVTSNIQDQLNGKVNVSNSILRVGATAGYVNVVRFTFNSSATYLNGTIIFEIMARGDNGGSKIVLSFKNTNTPQLEYCYNCINSTYTKVKSVYTHTSGYTCDIYLYGNAYDAFDLYNLHVHNYLKDAVTISYPGSLLSSLPSGSKSCSFSVELVSSLPSSGTVAGQVLLVKS